MVPMNAVRTLVLVSLFSVAARADVPPPPPLGSWTSPGSTSSAPAPQTAPATTAPEQTVPQTTGSGAPAPEPFPGALPTPGQPLPTTGTGSIPGSVPATSPGIPTAPDTTAGLPGAPASVPTAIPLPIPGMMPGMPGIPGTAGVPGGMPMDPAAALSLLGVPYTVSPDGRCATAQAGGYTINVCLDPNAAAPGAPAGPGNSLPPAPPKGGTLTPVSVQSGDTLGELCAQAIQMAIQMGLIAPPGPELWGAGGLVETVARHNQIENPNLIFPGQTFDMNVDGLSSGGMPQTMPAVPGVPANPAVPPVAMPVPADGSGPIAAAPGAAPTNGTLPDGFFLPTPPPLPGGIPQLPPVQ